MLLRLTNNYLKQNCFHRSLLLFQAIQTRVSNIKKDCLILAKMRHQKGTQKLRILYGRVNSQKKPWMPLDQKETNHV